jgi:hypothetical protein
MAQCVKSRHMQRAKNMLRIMVQGGSLTANFDAWCQLVQEKRDKEVFVAKICT